ncbi:hypothetical protein AB0F68_22460 [Micromonospora sp. NPDC023966]|uniref:hypothetical protein n=1 Tax=Micromonospora sp. NPDC023966 TaxID=3154699 RepID=UPI0033E1CF63
MAAFLKHLPSILAAIGPLVGVYLGATLGRRSSRDSFLRERIFAEMAKRREVTAAFKKAVWAYSSRVLKMLNLAKEAVERKAATGEKPSIQFDLPETLKRQEVVRDTFAELESFAPVEIQIAARNCMEALSRCFNSAAVFDIEKAMAAFAFYEQQYQAYATEVNNEAENFNALIYSTFTPVWKAVLRQATRKPLPYREFLSHPLELKNPQEKLFKNEVSSVAPQQPTGRDPVDPQPNRGPEG